MAEQGNVAAMREALEELMKFTCNSCNERFCEEDIEEEDGTRYCSPCNAIIKARNALSAPARNCDRFATKEDAYDEFMGGADSVVGDHWRFAEWLFAKAEGGAE